MSVQTQLSLIEFYGKMDSLLNLPAGSVKGTQLLSSLKNWDSLTILEFMVLVDTDYRSNLQPSDIAVCTTVDELATLTLSQSSYVQ